MVFVHLCSKIPQTFQGTDLWHFDGEWHSKGNLSNTFSKLFASPQRLYALEVGGDIYVYDP